MESQPAVWSRDLSTTGNHYPSITSNLFNDTLYKTRKNNDEILKRIIELNKDNNELESEINGFKQSLPPILLKWWTSNSGVEKIAIFLEKLGATLDEQMDNINNHMNLFKEENEVLEADYQAQQQQNQTLKQAVAEKDHILQNLIRRNEIDRQDIAAFKDSLPQMADQTRLLIGQNQTLSLQHQNETSSVPSSIIRQRGTGDDLTSWFIQHTFDRKKYFQERLNQVEAQYHTLQKQIEVFEREKKSKADIEKTIIESEQKKAQLNMVLLKVNQDLASSNKQKDLLERSLIQETMERAIDSYSKLSDSYKKIAKRCLELTNRSLGSPNMKGVQKMLGRE